MRVLIAGCGDLGTAAGLLLADRGYDVTGLRRSPERLPAAIGGVRADLSAGVPDLPGDVDYVVVATAADGRTEEAYRAAYVDGLRNLLDGLDHAGAAPRRMLMVSSTAVYGVDDGSFVDEDTPTEPASATGAVLVEAEQLFRQRVPDGVVFRLAGIYGPGRTYVIDQVRDGTATIPVPPTHTNRIHRDDAAAAIVHLLTEVTDPDRVYVGVDDAPADRGDVLRFIADELGVPHPASGPASGRFRTGDKRCRNTRLTATGFRLAFPTYREGYRAVLAGKGTRYA
jgi:nucleoside-diphosphate-sugar epimerase